MPQVINTNIASLNAQRNLGNSQMSLQTALQRLSSGLRLNSAKDDAAGLAISDRMTSQVRGLNQAVRNSNDGISMAQTAEGALGEIGNILQRVRELSIQAANATNSDSDRATLQSEVVQLKAELSRIASNTTFNGQKILNGSMQSAAFQVGADASQTIKMSINSASSESLGVNMRAADNNTRGLAVATNNYRVDSGGGDATLMGLAKTSNGVFTTSNAYSAQTLIIKDSVGNVLVGGSIGIAAGAQISDVAARLNTISGVRATGFNQLKITTIQSGLGALNTATLTVTLSSGNVTSTLNIAGVTAASSQSAIFTAIKDTINGDADLRNAGVVAGINAAGQVVVRNNTGADLGLFIGTSTTASTVVFSIVGSDVASTAVTISASGTADQAGGAVKVGGQLSIYLADGYSIQSNKAAASSYFNASASALVAAAANGVGIDDVVTNTIPSNYVAANGVLIGQAVAAYSSGVVANQTNAYVAQTLTIRDSTGTKLAGGDSIVIATAAGVDTVVSTLNNLTGVQATASAELKVTDYTTGAVTSGSFTLSIISGATSVNLVITGLIATSTDIDVFKAMRDAINADTTLTGAGVTASLDSTGFLSIKNNDGKNLGIAVSGAGAGSITTITLSVRGTDAAATVVTITGSAIAGNATSVGGTLKVALAEGYTISSNATKTNSYFDVNANAKASVVESGVNFGTRTAAQIVTIIGTGKGIVNIAKDDSADRIAQLINGQTVNTGVSATARTQAKLSNISAAGTVSFTLYGNNGNTAAISALVTGSGTTANLSALASAINNKSSVTGITASLADNNASLILKNETGANIVVANFNHSAASTATASNITGTQASMTVTGLADAIDPMTGTVSTQATTAVSLFTGGLTSLGADSTVVGGILSFMSADAFTVSSSVGAISRIGGNSSLLSTDTNAVSSSSLFNTASVDISTVDGANQAIIAIDGALTQVNAVRSAMGALQNRFLSTISSLSATSENIASARSRIQDTDFAAETANLTRSQILQQAGVAMLSQANQLPQLVLSLLK